MNRPRTTSLDCVSLECAGATGPRFLASPPRFAYAVRAVKPDAPAFLDNLVLFGRNPSQRIIAVEPVPGGQMKVMRRDGKKLVEEAQEFWPFLWVSEAALMQGFPAKHECEELRGDGAFHHLVRFQSWNDFLAARKHLSAATGHSLTDPAAPFFSLGDPVQQHLLATGQTFFKGMRFEELHRLQLDIETDCDPHHEFSNPRRESDRILCVALTDSRGWEHFLAHDDEANLLRELVAVIRERDPDVIEGHNIFKFDLEYIAARAKLRKVNLALGRDGSELSVRPSRVQVAERTINYPKHEIFGRHIVDTYLLVRFYDVSSRELESFSLKEVAKHFGVAAPRRTYLAAEEIAATFRREPGRVKAYALDDVRETRAIADILSQSYFVQAQIFPYSYQDVVVRGNATKIDSLFLREYLARRHSVPRPPEARPFAGGYTDIFFTGVARHVWHCDVQSLYPSIILSFRVLPKSDDLRIFQSLLRDLREFRLRAKGLAKSAKEESERRHYDALQSAFKVLINSFYGYLGFAQAHFGDFDAAERVTAKGREILTQMIEWLKERGAQLIEIDTDGVYFVPPKKGAEKLEDDLQATLPQGIEVEFDGRYQAMFSYKAKNYALLDERGRLSLTGGALRSRGLEKFQRQFLEEFLLLVLTEKKGEVPGLLERYRKAIQDHEWPVEMWMKTETLQDSLDTYRAKIAGAARNKSAAYELAVKSGRNYQPGDTVSFYITGRGRKVAAYENCKLASEFDPKNRDENVEYYLDKLDQLHARLAPLCGLPAKASKGDDPKQGSLF